MFRKWSELPTRLENYVHESLEIDVVQIDLATLVVALRNQVSLLIVDGVWPSTRTNDSHQRSRQPNKNGNLYENVGYACQVNPR